MTDAVILLAYALATARVTGLITADGITEGIRTAAVKRLVGTEDDPRGGKGRAKLAYLIKCAWCVSFWVGLAAAAVLVLAHDVSPILLIPLALAFSQVTGMLSDLGR